jgi:hypothetical protein
LHDSPICHLPPSSGGRQEDAGKGIQSGLHVKWNISASPYRAANADTATTGHSDNNERQQRLPPQ